MNSLCGALLSQQSGDFGRKFEHLFIEFLVLFGVVFDRCKLRNGDLLVLNIKLKHWSWHEESRDDCLLEGCFEEFGAFALFILLE